MLVSETHNTWARSVDTAEEGREIIHPPDKGHRLAWISRYDEFVLFLYLQVNTEKKINNAHLQRLNIFISVSVHICQKTVRISQSIAVGRYLAKTAKWALKMFTLMLDQSN